MRAALRNRRATIPLTKRRNEAVVEETEEVASDAGRLHRTGTKMPDMAPGPKLVYWMGNVVILVGGIGIASAAYSIWDADRHEKEKALRWVREGNQVQLGKQKERKDDGADQNQVAVPPAGSARAAPPTVTAVPRLEKK